MTTPEHLPHPFIPLHSEQTVLEKVGGKALNLARLGMAGFPVPDGFFVPTDSYREFVALNGLTAKIEKILSNLDPTSPVELTATSAEIRTWFTAGSVPLDLVSGLEIAWRWLGAHPVAVRSSATAEDLSDMSFAGQQDTFLNIIGNEALLEAVVQCWSSLWTARAIGYRARNNISHNEVALCVVVQHMVQSEASGVMFTANPLTGRRTETVIDATLGLGEALVGGQVEPDHFVVNTSEAAITQKFQGSKLLIITGKSAGGVKTQEVEASMQQSIPDEIILNLAEMGKEIEDLYSFPQDIEWAVDIEGNIFILQSRPITSLFPLPKGMRPEPLKFMIGLHTVQGVMEPYSPLGQDLLILILSGGGRAFGINHTIESQSAFHIAAERIFINMTPILRTPPGNRFYPKVVKAIDPGVGLAAEKLVKDPRFAPVPIRPKLKAIFRIARFAIPFATRIIRFLINPEKHRMQSLLRFDEKISATSAKRVKSGDIWEVFSHRMDLLHDIANVFPDFVIPFGIPPVVAGIAPFFGILERFSKEIVEVTGDDSFKTIHMELARGIEHNVTTEMDLSLWDAAKTILENSESAEIFNELSAPKLTEMYREGSLPPAAQNAIKRFLDRYGSRGLGEIDIGRHRWREDPTPVVKILQSYLQIDDPQLAPDSVFSRGAITAETTADKFIAAARKLRGGIIKAQLVRFGVSRYRALAGLREAPKFFVIRMMGILRQELLASGGEFVQAGMLNQPDDLFFLYIKELDEIAAKKEIAADLSDRIAERRALRGREMLRAQIPRVLLSDGTAFYEGIVNPDSDSDSLRGDPVSPGVVEGFVRVVINPHETQLESGEILVCPGTDPAWTPLFLTAGGLVMEVGGMMTHGSVVAREYGIPAVVGVNQATTRLKTGQKIRVDGSSGQIEIITRLP